MKFISVFKQSHLSLFSSQDQEYDTHLNFWHYVEFDSNVSRRKRESTVWQWFTYDDVSARSICSALTKDGKPCGVKLAG